jgi:hypothetical protein
MPKVGREKKKAYRRQEPEEVPWKPVTSDE